jgi:23S rRNA (cytosine1962-C5)-methyltransferase
MRAPKSLANGDVVRLVDAAGATVGCGVYDPESPIAVRMWASGSGSLSEELLAARLASAFRVREWLFSDGKTTAYRLLNGEGDRTPGFVLDRYGNVAMLRLDGAGAEAFAETFVPHVWTALKRIGVETLARRDATREQDKDKDKRGARMTTLFGPPPPDTIDVAEHGVPFVVDLARGQKTGAFLDQRENRRRVGELARGRRKVLNLFSYAGGFSLRAALAGATVTSVDVAAQAHATAQAGFKRAGVDPRAHEFVTADAFAYLTEAKKKGQRWDVVVSDPPSFAPNEKALPRAIAAYRTLHKACVDVLADGGVFCAASCSSHVDAEAFASTLDDMTLGRADLRLLEQFGPPADHPTLPGWREGRYLKFAVLA